MVRGRPRKIAPEKVLKQAMLVFWERGFNATSMNDISAETGMAKPGLYANFGDKESLYCKALTLYRNKYITELGEQLIQPGMTLRQSLESFLKDTADFVLNENQPVGCFIVNNNMECQKGADHITQLTQEFDLDLRHALEERFEKAKHENDLTTDEETSAFVDFYIGQIMALGALAKKGYSKDQLYNLIDQSLKVLP